MKKSIVILFAFLICASAAFAQQFKIRGKITNYNPTEKLQINIPLVYGFWEENSIKIPVRKDGSFAIVLLVNKQHFSNLTFQRLFHPILISPGKELVVNLDGKTNKLTMVGGSAVEENKVIQAVDIEEFPFFLKEIETYHKLSYNDLNSKVVVPYLAARDKKIALINKAPISEQDKKFIASEVTYAAYNLIFDISGYSQMENKDNIDHMIITLFDKLSNKPMVFPAGPQYYIFMRNYITYIDTKTFQKIEREKIKPTSPMPYYGIPFKKADELVTKYGRPYMRWIGSLKFFPDYITEIFTYQQIVNLCYNGMPSQAFPLGDAFLKKFPHSKYNGDIKNKLRLLLEKTKQ